MSKRIYLPILIMAGIAAIYFIGKSRLKRLKIIFKGLNVTGKIFSPKFNLKFIIQNPTNETANFKSLVGEVSANGKNIANVSSFDTTQILANNETQLNIIAEPLGISIVKTILSFLKNKNKIEFEFSGSANIDNIVYPISNKIVI